MSLDSKWRVGRCGGEYWYKGGIIELEEKCEGRRKNLYDASSEAVTYNFASFPSPITSNPLYTADGEAALLLTTTVPVPPERSLSAAAMINPSSVAVISLARDGPEALGMTKGVFLVSSTTIPVGTPVMLGPAGAGNHDRLAGR